LAPHLLQNLALSATVAPHCVQNFVIGLSPQKIDAGCWMLDAGCWMLKFFTSIQHPASSIYFALRSRLLEELSGRFFRKTVPV
jgi:hypothetical protein